MKPRRFVVVCLDVPSDQQKAGAAMLVPGCDEIDAERALVGIGVYAPRGPETIVWARGKRSAVVKNSADEDMITEGSR